MSISYVQKPDSSAHCVPSFKAASDVGMERKSQPKYPPPFSLRLSHEEKEQLKAEAGKQPLGAFIRMKLLGDNVAKRRTRRAVVADEAALARVLALMGKSRVANNLNQLAKLANSGSLFVDDDVRVDLNEACRDIKGIRKDLMMALGSKFPHSDY